MTFFGFVGGLSPNWIVLAVCMIGMGLAYGILIGNYYLIKRSSKNFHKIFTYVIMILIKVDWCLIL